MSNFNIGDFQDFLLYVVNDLIFATLDRIYIPLVGCSIMEMLAGMIFLDCLCAFFLPWFDYEEVQDI